MGASSRETAADAGTRSGAQRRAAEDGGWRVGAASRRSVLCTGRGGGELLKKERYLTMNDYGRGGDRKEEVINDQENSRNRWDGRPSFKVL